MGQFCKSRGLRYKYNFNFRYDKRGHNPVFAKRKRKLASQGIIVDPSMPVHPTFLYESVWCIIGFVLLLLHIKKKNFKGENLCLYVFWYGLGRFFIEGLRTDSLETFGGLRMSQLVALVSVVVSLGILIYMNIKIKKEKSKN